MKPSLFGLCSALAVCFSVVSCSKGPAAYLERGNKLFQENKYADATLNYKKALQRDPKFAEAYYRLGVVLLKQNQPQEALSALTQAVELAPSNDKAIGQLADLLLSLYINGNHPEFLYDRLTKLAAQVLAQNPSAFQGFRIRGYLELTDNKPGEAIQSFRHALEARPQDADASLALGGALIKQGQPAEAETVVKAAIEKHKDSGALYDLLYGLYLSEKRSPDAVNILQAKIRNNPKNVDFALQLADYYYANKQNSELTAAVQRILTDSNDYPDGRLQVAEFYALRQNWEQATAEAQEGIRRQPSKKADYQKLLMEVLVAQNKPNEALSLAESILKVDRENTAARAVRGALLLRSNAPGRLDAAKKDFQSLVDHSPDDPVFRFELGRIYQAKGDVTNAKQQYLKSAEQLASYVPPRLALAEMALAEQDYRTSIRYLKDILRYDTRNPQARVMLSAATRAIGDFETARQGLEAVLQDFPHYPAAEVEMAYVYLKEKRYREAEGLLQKHYQPGSHDLGALRGLVEVDLAEHHGTAALELIQGDIKNSSNRPDLQELLAATAVRAGQYDVAREQFKVLVAAQPNSATLHAQLGDLYRITGDSAGAIAQLEKAAELAPQQSDINVMLADLLANEGRAPEARRRYERALALMPDNAVVLNNLANLIADTGGNFQDGMKYAQRALSQDPQNPQIKDTMAWLYVKTNYTDTALSILDDLSKRYPNSSTYRYHLACAMLQKGERQEAKNQLAIALSNRPTKEEAVAIRKLLASIGSEVRVSARN